MEGKDCTASPPIALKNVTKSCLSLQIAPLQEELEKGIKVLDIGCGPGWWSLDMAKKYPKSQFIGIDITNDFPLDESLDNLSFQTINAGQGLPFSDNEFDYVFQRFLVMGFSSEQYRFVIDEIKRVLKPGGTVEILEMVSEYNDAGPSFQNIGVWSKSNMSHITVVLQRPLIYNSNFPFHAVEKALRLNSLDPRIATQVAGMLQAAGFTRVSDKLRRIPIGKSQPSVAI